VQPLLQRKSNKYYILWVCVCSLRYLARIAHALYYRLWPVRLFGIFSYYLINVTIFKTPLLKIKCAFWSSLLFCLKYFVWNILPEIFCLKYFVWNILSEIFCLKYFVWNILSEILCLKYFVWNILSEIFLVLARYDQKCVLVFIWSTRPSFQILIKLKYSRQIFEKYSNIKFYNSPSFGSEIVPWGRTKRQTQWFCERAWKCTYLLTVWGLSRSV
jgi:hypothetical protein